jgi:SAM-dependent methyltransferase
MNEADYGDFAWPDVPGTEGRPTWSRGTFHIGSESQPVLAYRVEDSGWSRELTLLHEESGNRDHPIDVASRAGAVEAIRPILEKDPRATVLEIGSSSGYFLAHLRAFFPSARIVGSDYIRDVTVEAAALVPTVPVVQMDIVNCPFADDSFDVAVALNVLEHIEDDGAALRNLSRIIKPGGILVLEVPAGPHLYDFYDEHLKHFRRYRMAELRDAVQAAGLEIVRSSHLGAFIYPAYYAVKKRNRMKGRIAERDREAQVAGQIRASGGSPLVRIALAAEKAFRNVVSLPFGVRCLVTARKPPATTGDMR